MKFKAVIFDLDGTLVDSVEDIANAMNTVLKNQNYPTHSYDDYQRFVGNGLRDLVTKSLPFEQNDENKIDYSYQKLIKNYRDNCTVCTKPYNGIIELLDYLSSNNIKLGVFSNKSDELTKKVVSTIFPNYFDCVVGLSIEKNKKPNPIEALEISKKLNLKAEDFLFIGDSGIDMQTATNANMYAVGVLWGYRPKEELVKFGAKIVLTHPLELVQHLI